MIDASESRRSVRVTDEVLQLFAARGHSNYGKEAVTQLEHALQAASFAEREQAPGSLIAAALLHDVGHLLHDLPADAPEHGVDDRHEALGGQWLRGRFAAAVVVPVASHVAAKRYLCAVDADYARQLSPPSLHSLGLQGGPMSSAEVAAFAARPYFHDAVRLRRWDDAAKVVGLATPPLAHFLAYIDDACLESR
jgi:phosphonate degradation associated HDIG domain protein